MTSLRTYELPPQGVLSAALILAAAAVALVIGVALSPSWLGVQWRSDGGAVVVDRVLSADAGDLRPGDRVIALVATDGRRLPLEAVDLTPEPDMAFTHYSEMDAFFARQTERTALLAGDRVLLERADGSRVAVGVAASRPLDSLPPVFWFQLLCAIGGLLAGTSVWAFRQRDAAAVHYAVTGFGMLLFASAAAIYSTRELVIDGGLFRGLSALNQFGALLFCGGLIAVLCHYPTRLGPPWVGALIVAAYALLGLAIPLRLADSVESLAHVPITLGYLSTYGLAALQWWRTRSDPLQRAALRAFLLAWLFGSGAFVAVMIVPAMAGIDNGAIQGYAFGFFLLIYAGIAAGVLRYRLFQLDRWWFGAWRLFFGGAAVIALDLLFIYVLRLDTRSSLLIALALAGWLYFPLRQWLWARLSRRTAGGDPALIERVTRTLAGQDLSEPDAWRALLQSQFAPLAVEADPIPVATDAITDNGLSVRVAARAARPGLRLRYPAAGTRLFRESDLRTLAELRALFDQILRYRGMLDAAVTRERNRVARDLHDDVGARLLTLSHRLPPEHAEQARQALAELRAVVHSMQAPRTSIGALLGQWRDEAEERCSAAGVDLRWAVEGDIPELDLGGGEALSLTRVLREALTNALRHATPADLGLGLRFAGSHLDVTLRHAYDGAAPDQWRASLGLHNLQGRLAQLGGHIAWTAGEGELVTAWRADLAAVPAGSS